MTPEGFEPSLPERKSGVLGLTRRWGRVGMTIYGFPSGCQASLHRHIVELRFSLSLWLPPDATDTRRLFMPGSEVTAAARNASPRQ